MTDRKYIAIIYEGEKTEYQLLNNLNKTFFHDAFFTSEEIK